MRKHSDFVDLSFAMFNESARRGIMYHTADDAPLDGRLIGVDGNTWVNFGSCSYLGLETDLRLKQGVIDAVMRYGSQFSSSRAMVSAPPYAALEEALGTLFGTPVLMCPNTSLGHIAAIPVLIHEDDLIVLDQQVHWSVQTAVTQAKAHGTQVELIRHNRMDQLEELIVRHRHRVKKIWYLADGLYSMYGDFPPLEALAALQAKYEQLHLYFDDAHAMSWCGPLGRGHVLGHMPLHDRMVVATSLNKAFASAGGVLLMTDDLMRRQLRVVGGPLIYSGPIQPPMLGAALASARIHLSDELPGLQAELAERIAYTNGLMRDLGVPVVAESQAPIRFVCTGLPRVTYNMVERLQREGFYLNVATFPVVPMKRSGLRFTITRHHRFEDLRGLVEAIAHHLPLALAQEGSSLEEVFQAFDLAPPAALTVATYAVDAPVLHLDRYDTIDQVDPALWDRLLGANGSFTVEGLRLLERTFQGQPLPENNWRFRYYIVRDDAGRPLLATFTTETVWKDDMLSARPVSLEVERRRRGDPYYLTSRTLALGALLTEGEHLYLDRTRNWRGAMALLLRDLQATQADTLVLRDLPAHDREMDAFLLEQGFAKLAMPDSLVLELDAPTEEAHLAGLSRRSRRHLVQEVLPRTQDFTAEVLADPALVPTLYQLYLNVKERNLDLNVFTLPEAFFANLVGLPGWDFFVLRWQGKPVAFTVSFVGTEQYVPLIVGLDYDYVPDHGAYRQCLLLALRRARLHGCKRIYFGMGATLEKQRFGAEVRPQSIYFQTRDHYNLDRLAQIMNGIGGS
ncbi:MAG: aminotransferase class I/II-fold pyridoxal phosphate-dependent enzyme [Cyanobacteria bacterium RYN_339]|nr:aminotransferase class I/II-fold pyridoxal phosphate-dependent enzyme [Cyanobacteria bacterium RYN_339]